MDYLSKLNFSTVLEVGCGFGRITRRLLEHFNISEYLAMDISPTLVNNAMKLMNNFTNIQFKVADIRQLQTEKKYDLVLGVEVLMHVPPTEINSVINKLVSISNKHVVNIDWYEEPTPEKHARHCFVHNFNEIYKENTHVININRIPLPATKQSIFHAQLTS